MRKKEEKKETTLQSTLLSLCVRAGRVDFSLSPFLSLQIWMWLEVASRDQKRKRGGKRAQSPSKVMVLTCVFFSSSALCSEAKRRLTLAGYRRVCQQGKQRIKTDREKKEQRRRKRKPRRNEHKSESMCLWHFDPEVSLSTLSSKNLCEEEQRTRGAHQDRSSW